MDRLAVIASESQRLADVLSEVDPGRRCPSCPDWSASDLLWHLTEVHLFWAGILARHVLDDDGLPAVEESKPPRPVAVADVLTLREQATAALIEQLARRADDEPCWSWWQPDQTVGFTRRMQTYEATMHRVDAELTAGLPIGPITRDVAAGAIDHAVDVMWGWMPDGARYRPHGVVELVAADTDQTWRLECGGFSARGRDGSVVDGPTARRAVTGAPTASVTGPVVDLARWAWTRGGRVRIAGDESTVSALNAVVTQGMP